MDRSFRQFVLLQSVDSRAFAMADGCLQSEHRSKENPMRLLVTWLINAAALFALPYLMKTIYIENVTTALVAALVLGLVNTLVRPILVLLTFPVTVLTLGLFILVINGLMFWGVAQVIGGFQVASFWSAVAGALVYSIISWALAALILKK